jgi:predicted metalloprotease with PDZ domain
MTTITASQYIIGIGLYFTVGRTSGISIENIHIYKNGKTPCVCFLSQHCSHHFCISTISDFQNAFIFIPKEYLLRVKYFSLLVLLLFSIAGFAQHVDYVFEAPNAAHHESQISVTATGLPAGPAIFIMSRSSPGRYATHEFGKNVYNVNAVSEAGKTLPVEKVEGDVFKVAAHKGTVKLTYTLYANFADGTYSDIDLTNFHLNIPATFMWVKGMEKQPITVRIIPLQKTWTVATQLKPSADPFVFSAPDLQYFMDSPIKVGMLHMRDWKVNNTNGKIVTFRLALDAAVSEQVVDNFTEKLKKIVAEAGAIFGEFPDYDFGTYTFIASLNPYTGRGDGMEHRNSTMITSKRLFTGDDSFLGVFAHEFFHCWNVERIRPKSLEPFNFEKANMSEALWLAEGFTHYYGDVLLVRAGLLSHDDFQIENSKLVNAMASVGATNYSAVDNSQRAVFVDAGVAYDRTNFQNSFTSYYSHGGAIALALDLQLRTRFNKSLDDVMQLLWKRFGKDEIPYTLADIEAVLTTVTDKTFSKNFFNDHVYHSSPIDYNSLLSFSNYTIQPLKMGKAWIGNVELADATNGVQLQTNTIINTPLYAAGLDVNDVIIELDGERTANQLQFQQVLEAHQPTDRMSIVYLHHGKKMEANIQLSHDPGVQIVPIKMQPTVVQQQFIQQWMGSKAR